ncbi:MAG: aminoacetone oxidase family FAD-binding enzyme [Candidatus Weimeria sp.]
MEDVIVIGSGASGLFAATAARESGAEVTVLEKNTQFAKKLLSTGNGRCNFTNLRIEKGCYHSDDTDRAMEIIGRFDQSRVIDFMCSLGMEAEYRDGWCYPRSMSALCVNQALISHARRTGVHLKGGKEVTDIKKREDHFEILVSGYAYRAKKVILACGGLAAPRSGSSGDGLQILKRMGVRIKKPLPALVPLVLKDNPLKKAAGVRVSARVSLIVDGREVSDDTGNLQITEYGISGIPVFQISSEAVRAVDQGRDVRVKLDFFPDYSMKEAHTLIEKSITEAAGSLSPDDPRGYLLMGLFPEKLAEVLAVMILPGSGSIGDVVIDSFLRYTDKILNGLIFKVSGNRGFEAAQTTSGGVVFDELNDDLSLKKIPGLYVCGEEADVDGLCGGYNLQWAFSSGYVAGKSAGGS